VVGLDLTKYAILCIANMRDSTKQLLADIKSVKVASLGLFFAVLSVNIYYFVVNIASITFKCMYSNLVFYNTIS
jgi:hypothetical protein